MKEKNTDKKIEYMENKIKELNSRVAELEMDEDYSTNVVFKEPVKNKYNR